MRLLVVDIESFYSKEVSLSKLSTQQYVDHKEFEVIGVAVKVDDEETEWFTGDEGQTKRWLERFDWDNAIAVAHNCVTGDHEVRTRDGWVRFDQLQDGVEVAQWDPKTEEISFSPCEVIRKPYKGKMYEWDTQYHKGCYTPEHRVYYKTPAYLEKGWRVATCENVVSQGPNNVYMPTGGIYESATRLPMTPLEARVLEMVRADGNVTPLYDARFKFKKSRKIERCKALLDSMGVPYSEVSNCGVTRILTKSHESLRWLCRLLGVGTEKKWGSWVLNLPIDARLAILNEAQHWDGVKPNKGTMGATQVHSSKKEDIYWFAEMAIMSGFSAKTYWDKPNNRGYTEGTEGHVLHSVTIRAKNRCKLVERAKEIVFDGTVYCVSVPSSAFLVRRNDAVWVTGNCVFDSTILTWRFGIKPKLWADTLSMARAIHGTEVGGSLKVLAEHYKLGIKGEEVLNAIGKHRDDFTEEEMARYGEYCRNDVELTYGLFQELAPHFNKVEMKLIDMTIRMHSEPKFELDLDVLEQHLYDVKKAKEETLDKCGVSKDELMSNDKFAEVLRSLGVEPPTKISPTTGKTAYAFAKTDDGLKELLEHDDIRVQTVVAARLSNKTTIEETRTQKFIDIANARDTIPIGLKYYGALTGRWSATEGTNFQNLPRTSPLKKAIKAPHGYKVVGADLSAIELRVGLFFANQMDKMQLIANGVDLYKDFAAKVFHVAYDDVDKDMRFIGKVSQLSLIYNTGHKKLRSQIKLMSGRDIGEDFAKQVVDLYRTDYASVKQSWYEGEEALDAMYNNQLFKFGLGPLKLTVEGRKGIRLPSGLFLRYPQLTQRETEKGHEWVYNKRPKMPDKLYGGKVFQSSTQALARCVMGEAMVRINKRYPLSLTVHDSCYAVVPEEEAQDAFDYIIKQLTTPPVWLPGIVLGAEGGIGDTLKDGG